MYVWCTLSHFASCSIENDDRAKKEYRVMLLPRCVIKFG